MNDKTSPSWYAIKTRREFEAERLLTPLCDEVFLPKQHLPGQNNIRQRIKAVIPHLLFIKTSHDNAIDLEKRSRDAVDPLPQFWIYRFHNEIDIHPISDDNICLIKLLTANDTSKCEVYNKTDFTRGQLVRVTAGRFAGYRGYVQRIKKNRHVIVKIEGICAIALPFIHPDLLAPVKTNQQ